jgi:ABC-type glycerol-3-phosphate transport system substrate-binding protein
MRTKAYLTAFWRIILGLSLLFSAAGCDGSLIPEPPPSQGTARPGATTPAPTARTAAPTRPAAVASLSPTLSITPPIHPPATPALSVTPADLSGVSITFWHPWSGEASEELQAILNEFNRNNRYGIRVQAQAFDGLSALEDAIQAVERQGGELPDLLAAYPSQARHLDAGGQTLVDLDLYVSDPAWGLHL